MEFSSRLYRLLKSVTNDKAELISEFLNEGYNLIDEQLKEWEAKYGLDEDSDETAGQNRKSKKEKTKSSYSYYDNWKTSDEQQSKESTKPTSQLEEDLQLFGLTPPVTLAQVKQVRNREIKKFHPDKFLNEPKKLETAKKILQIYNAAYERLKKELN